MHIANLFLIGIIAFSIIAGGLGGCVWYMTDKRRNAVYVVLGAMAIVTVAIIAAFGLPVEVGSLTR